MSKSLEQEFFEKFIKFGVLPVLAIFGVLLLIFLPLQHFLASLSRLNPHADSPSGRIDFQYHARNVR